MVEILSAISSVVILVAGFLVAVTNIYNFFAKSGKGIKKRVDEINEEKEKEFNKKVEAKIQERVKPMLEQQAATLTASFSNLLDQFLPERLVQHDHETRQKYLNDRQRYLCEIKDEVVHVVQDRLDAVDTHEERMVVFSEVLKELLRERIMLIYGRNKASRQLEEHEKIELDRAYCLYKKMNGNSYIDEYFARMKVWKIVPDEVYKENTAQ